MPFNLTMQKINNLFLILYVEISVLIWYIPHLFLTNALVFFSLFSLSSNAVHSSILCMMSLKMVILFKDSFILLMYKVLGRKKLVQVNELHQS